MSNNDLVDHAIHAIDGESAACLVYCLFRDEKGDYELMKFGSGDLGHLEVLAAAVKHDFTDTDHGN